jgi:hypothetical protein
MSRNETPPRASLHRLRRTAGTLLLGGVIFTAIFFAVYQFIPANYYQSRDDGIITLSHARNLADYGVIGVNPAGERVEGYSAPLQLAVYFLFYAVFGVGYSTFFLIQTLAATFLLGGVFLLFFRESPLWGGALAVLAAGGLASSTGFLEWHGSGMENPYTHLLVLLALWVSWQAMERDRVTAMTVTGLFLAAVVRSEFIGHVLPLLILLAVYFLREKRNFQPVLRLALVPVLWGGLQLARVWYFGAFFPNSAYAQSISIQGRLAALWQAPAAFTDSIRPALGTVLSHHNGYLFLLLIPCLALMARDRRRIYFFLLILSLAVTTLLSLVVFGPARLDETRITTPLALLTVFFWCWLIFHLKPGRHKVIAVTALLLLGVGIRTAWYQPPYYLCCSGPDFEHIRTEFLSLQARHDLGRATIANPDLGVISYHKDFNIVDLGCLGSPVLARIQFQPELVATYFFEFAAPDIVECHPTWMADYPEIFRDPRFAARYERVDEKSDPWFAVQGVDRDIQFWIRREIQRGADTAERRLMDDLAADLSLDRLRRELAERDVSRTEPVASQYVTRAAYRFLPEFRARGEHQQLLALFRGRPSARYDLAVLDASGRPDWYREVIAVMEEASRRPPSTAGKKP